MKRNVLSRLKKHSGLLGLTAAAVLLAVSCQSVPQKAEMESSVSLLPEGSDVIIRVNVDTNRELIEPVLSLFADLPPKLTDEFLERTTAVYAGLDFNTQCPPINGASGSTAAFSSSLVAEGDYPASMIEWGLFWDSAWKKQDYKPVADTRKNLPYWYEEEGSSQLAFPNNDYLFASSGSIEEMIGSWSAQTEMPVSREWLESEQKADLTIMTRNLSAEDYGMFIPQFSKVPLKSLILSLKRIDDDYLISGRFSMENEMSSFLFATLFRTMVIATKNEDGSRLFANPRDITIMKDGSDVVLDGMMLPAVNVAEVETLWLGTAGLK